MKSAKANVRVGSPIGAGMPRWNESRRRPSLFVAEAARQKRSAEADAKVAETAVHPRADTGRNLTQPRR